MKVFLINHEQQLCQFNFEHQGGNISTIKIKRIQLHTLITNKAQIINNKEQKTSKNHAVVQDNI